MKPIKSIKTFKGAMKAAEVIKVTTRLVNMSP